MARSLLWLSDGAWAAIEPHLPKNQPGARRVDDRRVISGISGRRNRKRAIRYDQQRYRGRKLIENAFCRSKDFRRFANRYDKLAANFLSAVALATTLAFWL